MESLRVDSPAMRVRLRAPADRCGLGRVDVTAGLVLLGYRPGGPLDLVVGATTLVPIAIAAVGLVWPPVARIDGAFAAIVWLGIATLLVLVPSIGGVLNQLLRSARRRCCRRWRPPTHGSSRSSARACSAASAWPAGSSAVRRRAAGGWRRASPSRVVTPVAGAAVRGGAIANELAPARPAVDVSRFGPTDRRRRAAACDAALDAADRPPRACTSTASVDLRPDRHRRSRRRSASGDDFRWLAYVATNASSASTASARIGDAAWIRAPGGGWVPAPPAGVADETLDLQALDAALTPGDRATAEDRGVEVIEGARARHCRIAIDGADVPGGVPAGRLARRRRRPRPLARPARLLDLPRRPARPGRPAASTARRRASSTRRLQGDDRRATLTATERGRAVAIYPPARMSVDDGRRRRRSAEARPPRPAAARRRRPAGPSRRHPARGHRPSASACPSGPSTATSRAIEGEIGVAVWSEDGLGASRRGVPAAAQADPATRRWPSSSRRG